ncbi:MAG: hypothetical protein EOP48_05580 [Sphingobacteriales bacterium]|nr:MAG: hypothetical protein EOP48_05580 [Sphingobacteriales bacterium]
MKNEEQLILSLLRVVNDNKGISSLLYHDLSYKEIGDLTQVAVDRKLITRIGRQITLTEQGKELLSTFRSNLKTKNKKEWIKPEESSQIEKLPDNFIFLPNPNDLSLD